MKKKVIALMLAAAMVVGVTACGGGSDNNTTAPAAESSDAAAESTDGGEASDDSAAPADSSASAGGKVLSVQIGPNPETIDPALNSAVDGGNMILHTFECLLTVDQDGKLAPGQAETWDISEDGLTWTFHLRDGLKWSDGSALTANDFVYSWQRVCDPMVAAPYAETVLSMVEGYEEAIGGNISALDSLPNASGASSRFCILSASSAIMRSSAPRWIC